MSSIPKEQLLQHRGHEMQDASGEKIGTIEEIYLDEQTGEPEWALVNTGMFGTKSSFVPLRDATDDGDSLRVPYETVQVNDAPKMVDPDGQLSQSEESELYSHYGLDVPGPTNDEAVVDEQAVPKERVRLDKETLTDEQQVSDTVRKEQIDVDNAGRGSR